jgi:hypothetical protein
LSSSVLFLTTYPLVTPRHGGQLRARALIEAYKAAGFLVTQIAVVEENAFRRQDRGPNDFEFPSRDPRWFLNGKDLPLSTDLRSGPFAVTNEVVYRKIRKRLPRDVDVIHLEQPWLLPLAKRLKSEPEFRQAVVVYGSQNIEAPLRSALLRQMQVTSSAEVVDAVAVVEADACRTADLTLAVTHDDEAELQRLGAARVLVAANGISEWKASRAALTHWKQLLNCRRIALFVGSAHPPNFDGFARAFGDGLGFVPPDCQIVVAGGVGGLLSEHYSATRYKALDLSRLTITGEIGDDDLAALKTLTAAFLLPIFDGGGSNIKTAEALLSGKRVIGTSLSLRGYDRFLGRKEVTVAATRDEFRAAVRRVLSPDQSVDTPAPTDELRSSLLWSASLGAVPMAVRSLLGDRRR